MLYAAGFPGVIPGQAVPVSVAGGPRNPSATSAGTSKAGTLRGNTLRGGAVRIVNNSDGVSASGGESHASITDEDEDYFYDAEDDQEFEVTLPTMHHHHSVNSNPGDQ